MLTPANSTESRVQYTRAGAVKRPMHAGSCRSQATFCNQLESAQRAALSCPSRGIPMTVLYPIRKACPVCGKPMKVVPDNQTGRERYLAPDAKTTRCTIRPSGSGWIAR